MPESAPPEPARRPISRQNQRLLWLLVIAAWLALAAWGIMTFRSHLWPRFRGLPVETRGEYRRVEAFVAPLALRLDNGRVVKPAGAAVPGDAPAAERAAARLRELAPPGTDVFVEFEPQLVAAPGPLPASIWLPPDGAGREMPFPYERSRLAGAVLVQEGLVAVDPDQPYMYKNEFEMLEDDARRHGRGIWGADSAVASMGERRLYCGTLGGWHGHAVAWPCKPPNVEHGHATAWPCHPAEEGWTFPPQE